MFSSFLIALLKCLKMTTKIFKGIATYCNCHKLKRRIVPCHGEHKEWSLSQDYDAKQELIYRLQKHLKARPFYSFPFYGLF